MSKSFSVSPEVNLIGMTTDEAVPTMEKYLDDAYLAHLPSVRVVHGRGTGALKTACHKRLKQLKYVKDFRLVNLAKAEPVLLLLLLSREVNYNGRKTADTHCR